jgi:protein involved in polysaccharide export with SLBB domain
MNKFTRRFDLKTRCAALVALAVGVSAVFAFGQQAYPPSRAVQQSGSRAEEAAQQMVSLSEDKIVALLRTEAGLLLEVKKLMVRTAYEQGRILDPKDLTDEAVFRLIHEDESIRVLVTREIEDRYYLRAKPTREELRRGMISEPFRGQAQVAGAGGGTERRSQEELYWMAHEGREERYPERFPVTGGVQGASQSVEPAPPAPLPPDFQYPPDEPERPLVPPESPQSPDLNRQLQRADMDGDYPDNLGGGGAMDRISPDQFAQLMNASGTDRSSDMSSMGGQQNLAALAAAAGMGGTGLPAGTDISSLTPPTESLPPPTPLSRPPSPAARGERKPQQPALRHRPNPYADVPALYDLYSQYSGRPANLQRFGSDIFHNGTGNLDRLPMDLPVGPEYVLGPGDGLRIVLWGGVSQRLQRVVDRQGRLALPEVGTLEVAGKTLGEVQRLVQAELRTQLRDVQADVSLARLRSVRVYVVGDVQRPGAYDISSLSTPLNALYIAGGPTSGGSLRIVRHYRGKQLVQETDLYDLLLHGVRSDLQGLQPGDTILVPPLGPEVTIEGMVRRPAIYELHGEKNLSEVLELAGGVMQSGTLRHVDVERVQSHLSRSMLRLDIPEDDNQTTVNQALDGFQIQDGDKVKISPILPYADKTVYLAGHVFRPGKFAYRDGMKLTDVIHSYNELLPEPYKQHAEIIRLNPPDYTPQVLAFNLEDALAGKDANFALKPFDTIRVFGRFDFEDPPLVTVTGEVRDPGDHITNGATYLRDAVYLAGGTTQNAALKDAQVFRKTDDGQLDVLSVNLSKALAGEATDNILLQPKDRVFIHKNLDRTDPATVSIQGEVARPGKYPLGENLTAAGLVRLAGGLKRSAYSEEADLTRYPIEQGTRVVGEHVSVPLARALAAEPDSDMRLHDGDVLTVRQLSGWNDIGATIQVKGEVVHPGTYGIQDGERLSSILSRAGGFRGSAYPYGAVLERAQVRDLEEKNRGQLIREIQDQGAALRQAPDTDADQKLAKEAALQQWHDTLQKLANTPPEGRLVIHISGNTKKWANTPADVQVRAGDSIYIPKRPNTVIVDGSVYNPTAITYKPGRSAGWYLHQAGGPTNMANKKAVFMIRADGSVVGGAGGMFTGGVERADVRPGDTVVVPEKAFSANTRWKSILEGAQLAYAVGIAIQVARSF